MQSRVRKYRKSFDNYQQAIQKQLNDDFLVGQYLDNNKHQGNNMQQYLRLFDTIQVSKNQKKKKYHSLKLSYQQMTTDKIENITQSSNLQNFDGIKEEFIHNYQQTQIKTSNQIQIKNTLWKEILQTKKSLNLLKGDIGHLVSRNQSANLLQSKIMKVKIVADDQFKRVSMAYSKDKDQIKIRGQMQKKFNNKLKNVSMFENTTLSRLKKNYISTMVKKRQIHDRLTYIQRVGGSIMMTGDKQGQKNRINRRSLQMYNNFIRLTNLIQDISQIQQKYSNTPQQQFIQNNKFRINQFTNQISSYCNQENNNNIILRIFTKSYKSQLKHKSINNTVAQHIDSEDLEMINSENLNLFENLVKQEYQRITNEIEKHTSLYNLQVKKSQEFINKLQYSNQEINHIQSNYINQVNSKYIINKDIRQSYSDKLKKFINLLKTIFALLQYIQKNINYSSKPTPLHHRQTSQLSKQVTVQSSQTICLQQNNSNLLRPSTTDKDNASLKVPIQSKNAILSEKSIAFIHKNYISQLFKIYYILLKQDQQSSKLDNIQNNLFDLLYNDVTGWLNEIKYDILQGNKRLRPIIYRDGEQKSQRQNNKKQVSSKMRQSRLSQLKTPKNIDTQQQQINQAAKQYQYDFQNYNRHHTVHREDNFSRHHSYSSANLQQHKQLRGNSGMSINKSSQKLHMTPSSNIVNVHKLKNCTTQPVNYKKAMRIKFLQDLDKDYYKMLKSTIKMQKQNTRKNYQFVKTFKRAKYSSRDEILEQKRYECSFSMLFAGKKIDNEKSQIQLRQKSGFFNNAVVNSINENGSQMRVSRLYESRKIKQQQKLIKSGGSSINLIDRQGVRQYRQNVKNMRQKKQQKNKWMIKRNLSIQMKDIINLI